MMVPIIVVECDREMNGPVINAGLEQITERDDCSHGPQGIDLSAKHLDRQSREDSCGLVARLADPVIDQDEVAPPRPSGLNGRATQ